MNDNYNYNDYEAQMVRLTDKWRNLKEAEKKANSERIEVEADIYRLNESSRKATGKVNFFTGIAMTFSQRRKWDQDKLQEVVLKWPTGCMWPFKTEYKENSKVFGAVKEAQPQAYKLLEQALTVEDAKPTFSFKE